MNKIFVLVILSGAFLLGMSNLPAQTDHQETQAGQVSQDFTRVAKQAIPAVVSIKAEMKAQNERQVIENFPDEFFNFFFGEPRGQGGYKFQQPEPTPRFSQGSGVIVTQDGYVITNNHVIDESDKITVQLNDGREYPGKVVGKDPNSDVAILKIDATNLPHLDLGDSNALEVGEWVVAVGNPLGLQATLTVGVVSAKGRSNLSIANYEDFIQTDAAINRGNSGGPLMNLHGQVIGINTAIASTSGGYMGIGFAIPSNVVKLVMEQIIEKGAVTRGYMGVTLQAIDQDLAVAFNLPVVEGALINDVAKDSPAQAAGLKQGDIILEYNGHHVDNIGSFRNSVSLMRPGTVVQLKVQRGKEQLTIPVTVGSLPEGKQAEAEVESAIGITVERLTPELADTYGYQGDKGVVVSKVNPKSAAALTGIKKGTLILSVDQIPVTTVEEFQAAVKKTEGAKGTLLLVKQGPVTRYIFIKSS